MNEAEQVKTLTEADIAAFLRSKTAAFNATLGDAMVLANVSEAGIVCITVVGGPGGFAQGQATTVADAIAACERAIANKPKIEALRAEIKRLEAAA